MTVRSNPQIGKALAFGFVSGCVSWIFFGMHSPIWSMNIGAGICFLILFFYPSSHISIELSDGMIRLSDGNRHRSIESCDVEGYRILRIVSFHLELRLKNGESVTHPLSYITSLSELKKNLQTAGIQPLPKVDL